MASTITLQSTINWAQAFLGYLPLNVGTSNEPAITSGNTILQTILSAPFKWRWNRASTTFTTAIGTQDYTEAISDFGYIETVTVKDSAGNYVDVSIKNVLGESSAPSRPQFVAVQLDDDAGNITFRLLGVPDAVYTVTVVYQKRAPALAALSSTWSPIPDYMSYVYQWGFLALMAEYTSSDSVARLRQLFVASLIGLAEGISEQDRSLFITSWLGEQNQIAASQQNLQLASKARGI